MLKSEKDLEDAYHLREILREHLQVKNVTEFYKKNPKLKKILIKKYRAQQA